MQTKPATVLIIKGSKMNLSQQQLSLITSLEKEPILSGRYTDIRCVNASNERRVGVISLVFKAIDTVTNNPVAIKFLDPDIMQNIYRFQAFEREPEILRRILNKRRCLQLIENKGIYEWKVYISPNDVSQPPLILKMKYFVTEWIPEDVDSYFFNQHITEAKAKLQTFRKIVLSVDAIHREGIHHRDLKPDNIRARDKAEKICCVIDFGTAAHLETDHIETSYPSQVGALGYAAPESRCGLAGVREIGTQCDMYALGCMLFELFNVNLFYFSQLSNQNLEPVLTLMTMLLHSESSEEKKIAKWKSESKKYKHVLQPAEIDQAGHSIPIAIVDILKKLHKEMTDFNFHERSKNLEYVVKRIDLAIRILENDKFEKHRIKLKKQFKENKNRKLMIREEKLKRYLSEKRLPSC